ncbi:MAG: cation diffusion facilitator family transporter [Alphaproteobacteria bacterium]|nr:cation diffusion facilitator family transporter [Alphaproteobacteria bacterium]MBU0859724.1 cation diffusion facilitator family transporter [Alphaproteobacteria bacterium]
MHNIDKDLHQPRAALWAGVASLVTVTLLIIAKAATFWFTGAASILASLMDSVLDASVSVMMFMAIRYSLKPADKDHRHGHGKIEGLAALFQAILIAAAGLLLLWEAGHRFANPHEVTGHGVAVIVMVLTILASFMLVMIQNYTLKRAPSLAVEADKAHYGNDIIVNGGVIVTIIALYFGAPAWVDPLFAIGVALYLGLTVWHIGSRAIDMLLDRELPDVVRKEIKAKVNAHQGVLGMHDLRTSQSGMKILISFDIEVDQDLSLLVAHNIARDVEMELLERFPHAEIMIHVDPHGDTEDSRHTVAGVHH